MINIPSTQEIKTDQFDEAKWIKVFGQEIKKTAGFKTYIDRISSACLAGIIQSVKNKEHCTPGTPFEIATDAALFSSLSIIDASLRCQLKNEIIIALLEELKSTFEEKGYAFNISIKTFNSFVFYLSW